MPSIVTVTTCPSFRNGWSSLALATPLIVPVTMRSPGRSVVNVEA